MMTLLSNRYEFNSEVCSGNYVYCSLDKNIHMVKFTPAARQLAIKPCMMEVCFKSRLKIEILALISRS